MLTKPNILIVEDDPDHLAIIEHYLAKCRDRIGEMRSVGTLAAARSALAAGAIDVVFLDLTLPASSLDETVDRISELLVHGAPIVALSSLDAPDLAERVRANGATGFLAKRRIDEAAIRSVLDLCHGSPVDAAPQLPAVSALASSSQGASTPDRVAELASRLAHDTNSWLANLSFRTELLESDPGLAASETAAAHLASMRASIDAATEYVLACRGLVLDGASEIEMHPIAFEDLARMRHRTWSESTASRGVRLDASELPTVLADAQGLGTLLEALMDNVALHWRPPEASSDDPTLKLRQVDSDGRLGGASVTIEATDNGGPWAIPGVARLGDPFAPVSAEHPGLGLYRVTRWMERMNGSAAFLERSDAAGRVAVRLTFLPA